MANVTIIIPVHNLEKYIIRCLESIYNQSYTDYECLIIENGSKDNSITVIKEYIKDKPKYKLIVSDILGVSNARNIGIDNANGRYITFIDGDDYVSLNYIEELVKGMENNENIDLVITHYLLDYGDKISDHRHILDYGIYCLNLSDKNLINIYKYMSYGMNTVWGKLYKLSLINENKIRFENNLKYGEDACFLYEYFNISNKILSIKNAIYYYYRNRSDCACNLISNKEEIEQLIKVNEIISKKMTNNVIKSLSDILIVKDFLGNKFGHSRYRKLSKSECIKYIEPIKNHLLSITLDKNIVGKFMYYEWIICKKFLSTNMYPYYPKITQLIRRLGLRKKYDI